MRGTLGAAAGSILRRGFTPAHAGNTHDEGLSFFRSRVHPRTCGEHLRQRGTLAPLVGSPPHMRGTPNREIEHRTFRGFTPAYAGNTCAPFSCCPSPPDHPRVCEEHKFGTLAPPPLRLTPAYTRNTFFGHVGRHMQCVSTPTMRGTRRYPAVAVEGFTPAHAGNTPGFFRHYHRREVHPRICGEHSGSRRMVVVGVGSPPHMRGTLALHYLNPGALRFTPAHAGNTLVKTAISSQNTNPQHTLQLYYHKHTVTVYHNLRKTRTYCANTRGRPTDPTHLLP